MNIADLLRQMDQRHASDLFLTQGKRPYARIYGKLNHQADEELTREDFDEFFAEYLPQVPERLETARNVDVGISFGPRERYRLNVFFQKGRLAMAVRRVPIGNLEFGELGLPSVVSGLAQMPRGLVLVTGATGSGKSSTMAAMLNHINQNEQKHIVTIEDPIEFVHEDHFSLVTQREVGSDAVSFADALRNVVRQSPDVIFIGEMRDLETLDTAISAAMTGHLVITTMHTMDAVQTLERIVGFFPDHLRDQVATDLALALQGIVCQRLIPHAEKEGLIPVCEILVATPLARRLIAERRFDELPEVIKTSSSDGMVTFTRSLIERFEAGEISLQDAATAATNREEFLLAVQGLETGIDTLRSRDDSVASQLTIKHLLRSAVKHKASDLILTRGVAPVLRIDGDLHELNLDALTASDTKRLLFSILTPNQRAQFEREYEIDFALSVSASDDAEDKKTKIANNRFRVNGFYQKGAVAVALRVISQQIPSAKDLGLPPVVLDLANKRQGLVLITGPTGHGKSTTLACLINEINTSRSCHIITIEDPIEYVHANRKAVVEQREVHADTKSFAGALKYILRQDPDVILIGEMRDAETIGAALTAAETGHLVFATLHTNDAAQTVDRIIDSFPPHQQGQVRSQLATALNAVVAQRLLPRSKGEGRVAAFEIMLGTTAVAALIRDNRAHQIMSTIETSAKDGMISMDKAVVELYHQGKISRQTVRSICRDPNIV